MTALALAAAAGLAAVHLGVARIRFLQRDPPRWSSLAGGVGITYVFMVLLPKLAAAQDTLAAAAGGPFVAFLAHHSYLVALAGLVVYHGLDTAIEHAAGRVRVQRGQRVVRLLVQLHAGGLAGYHFLVGYLLVEGARVAGGNATGTVLFALAMAVHFVGLDHEIRHRYPWLYDRRLRWLFAAASLGGAVTGAVTLISPETLALLNALFAGGLIVLTLKDKVPGRGSVRFGAFLVGVVAYAGLVLAFEAYGKG
jgi:hypothetical protein